MYIVTRQEGRCEVLQKRPLQVVQFAAIHCVFHDGGLLVPTWCRYSSAYSTGRLCACMQAKVCSNSHMLHNTTQDSNWMPGWPEALKARKFVQNTLFLSPSLYQHFLICWLHDDALKGTRYRTATRRSRNAETLWKKMTSTYGGRYV